MCAGVETKTCLGIIQKGCTIVQKSWIISRIFKANTKEKTKLTASDTKSILVSSFAGILVAFGLFYVVVLMGNSWIKWVLISLTLVNVAVWLISHGRLKRTIKYTIIGLMIFAICFASIESQILQNAGFAPEFEPIQNGSLISKANILNASLMEILISVKNSIGYNFITLEHPGEITFESMTLDTTSPTGRIDVELYQRSSSLGFHFAANNGNKYYARVREWGNLPLSQTFGQKEPAENALKQIDTLGLNWFYNTAIEQYKNQTGKEPIVDEMQISMQWETRQNYQGLTLLIMAYKTATIPGGGVSGHGVFFADFQPDGTMLYLSIASD